MDESISERCMFVTPIRLDLLLTVNQISCCEDKWYVRRFDPDIVQNGHIYSSIKEEEIIFIYWVYFDILCGLGLVIYEMNLLCNLMYHYSCYVY